MPKLDISVGKPPEMFRFPFLAFCFNIFRIRLGFVGRTSIAKLLELGAWCGGLARTFERGGARGRGPGGSSRVIDDRGAVYPYDQINAVS